MADIDKLRPTPSYPVRPVHEDEAAKRREKQSERKPPESSRQQPKRRDDGPQVDEYA